MAIVQDKQCTVNTLERGKKYQALSADRVTWYDLEVQAASGNLTCSCPARGECYHQRMVRGVIAADAAAAGWQVFADRMNAKAVAAGVVSAERGAVERQAAQLHRHPLGNGGTFLSSATDGEGWL
jgi:hypothetical protein